MKTTGIDVALGQAGLEAARQTIARYSDEGLSRFCMEAARLDHP